MPFGAQDVSIFFRDGVIAQLADGTASRVHINYPEVVEEMGAGGIVKAEPQMEFDAAAFPALFTASAKGVAVTINDVAYKVRWVTKIGDGSIALAQLGAG